ncbi:type II secretion system protein [Apilactobacillus kunkeei]|uniref:prepilin-type N-terminal cleavage/methylation domain-containing protein n=1 Tax=Apilactobacillus kunkeei TaxID=148814 RepID=UPI00110D0442|nr:prepilin-type N-terminal cleavage/methylation domain-containing protein [Apilactobacillus kunkeei]TMT00858.1 type II secretion system protein [Apilactobacillus kunkeei]
MKKSKDGFTTIEMLIVLIISSFFMSLCIFLYQGTHINDQELEKEFWVNFREYWKQAIENSAYTGWETNIYEKDHDIIFSNKGHHNKLRMPDSMHSQDNLLITVNNDGYVPPQTYEWYSKNTHTRYLLKVQLGGGIYKIYEKYYE